MALNNLPEHLIDHAALGVKSQTQLDSRYVNLSGDTMTGILNVSNYGIILKDSDGVNWLMTVDTDGAIITTRQATMTGQPIGLLLSLTYS